MLKRMQDYGIGDTSLKELKAINRNRIFVKLEKENALGSIKARTAYGIMKELPREAQNKIIVESTSGNLGLALGFFCRETGHPFLCLIDSSIASAKLEKLRAHGIEYEMVAQRDGMDLRSSRICRAQELIDSGKYHWVNQYDNPASINIHYRTTGPEIWDQLEETLTDIVCCMGSCGTICGISKFVKEKDRRIQVCGVEPYGSTIFGEIDAPYINVGAGLVGKPGNLIHSRAEVDAHMTIPDEKSIEYAERLYREYGLTVGVTSGMCYAAVDRYAQDITGHTIVFIAPDGRESYGEYFH